ncbi:MAG: hypothetical protein J7647_01140 [Cyanobacteria bacterium SBLK]|nr:hypothetical protein [Cyanobacteria bacterium SBLK]
MEHQIGVMFAIANRAIAFDLFDYPATFLLEKNNNTDRDKLLVLAYGAATPVGTKNSIKDVSIRS